MTLFSKFTLFAFFACANPWLFAQTKIKLYSNYNYLAPPDEPSNVPGFRALTNNPWARTTGIIYIDDKPNAGNISNSRKPDGIVKVHCYNGTVVNGIYTFGYQGSGYSGRFTARFSTVKQIRKIEFYDINHNKMFEDVFEDMPIYKPTIVRTSNNSFNVPNNSAFYLSIDGGKSWEYLEQTALNPDVYNIDKNIIENPKTIIAIIGRLQPCNPGITLWSVNPEYVLEFADDETPSPSQD